MRFPALCMKELSAWNDVTCLAGSHISAKSTSQLTNHASANFTCAAVAAVVLSCTSPRLESMRGSQSNSSHPVQLLPAARVQFFKCPTCQRRLRVVDPAELKPNYGLMAVVQKHQENPVQQFRLPADKFIFDRAQEAAAQEDGSKIYRGTHHITGPVAPG